MKILTLIGAGFGLMVAFQNCSPANHEAAAGGGGSAQPLLAVEMTKSADADDKQSFSSVHQLVVLQNDRLEIKTACGPIREARIQNLDSNQGILDTMAEIAIRIDNIQVKQVADQVHALGCASDAMVETEELLDQVGRIEKARRDGSFVYFTTAEGLVLTFQLLE